jgi:hypothetical protein
MLSHERRIQQSTTPLYLSLSEVLRMIYNAFSFAFNDINVTDINHINEVFIQSLML